MPKVHGRFSARRKSKTDKSYILSLYPPSGLPPEICDMWQRKSFSRLPPELAAFHHPKSDNVANNGAEALIGFLKKQLSKGTVMQYGNDALPIGDWLVRFTSLDNNPRAERLIADGVPYSPATVEDLYMTYYNRYIKDDPFLLLDLNTIDVPATHAFMARIGMKRTKPNKKNPEGRVLTGTMAYEVIIGFVRMAFREYWEDHRYWQNLFSIIDAPVRVKSRPRDILDEEEILRLFMPGVIADPLERAVAYAMFWAGLRRAEIFGLKTEDLVWGDRGFLRINNAWKQFGNTKKRTLGDPKWHKLREAPFTEELQAVVKNLQEEYGIRDFVFSYRDGSIPHGKWIQEHLPKWLERAEIKLNGRKVVPHSARHGLATILEANGVPLRCIQEMLGHASMKTTLGYLHTPEGMINKLTKKIEEQAAKESNIVPFGAKNAAG